MKYRDAPSMWKRHLPFIIHHSAFFISCKRLAKPARNVKK